jgi:hypothetical protein
MSKHCNITLTYRDTTGTGFRPVPHAEGDTVAAIEAIEATWPRNPICGWGALRRPELTRILRAWAGRLRARGFSVAVDF